MTWLQANTDETLSSVTKTKRMNRRNIMRIALSNAILTRSPELSLSYGDAWIHHGDTEDTEVHGDPLSPQ